MTDYLEEALDNAETLLEQMRRLERGFFKPVPETVSEAEDLDPAPEAERARAGGPDRRAAGRDDSLTPLEGKKWPEERAIKSETFPEWEWGSLEIPRRASTPLEAERGETSPLLDQLETLERAASHPAPADLGRGGGVSLTAGGADPLRREAVFPDVPDMPRDGRRAGSGAGSDGVSAAEGLRWAEQADRAFRRDSRRYDGGFYLY